MKIVINACFGGFGMSDEAIELYKKYIESKDPDIVFTDDFFSRKASNHSLHWSQHVRLDQAMKPTNERPIEHKKDVETDIGVKIPRYDPCLIRVVEELGDRVNNSHSFLTIVEIDDDTDWIIQEYDGYEWISRDHKILTYYPMFIDKIIRGKGTESQEVYIPNQENGFRAETPPARAGGCNQQ